MNAQRLGLSGDEVGERLFRRRLISLECSMEAPREQCLMISAVLQVIAGFKQLVLIEECAEGGGSEEVE